MTLPKPFLLCLSICAVPAVMAHGPAGHGHAHEHPRATPRFTENLGQWEHPARFVASSGPLTVFLEEKALTWSLLQADFADVLHHHHGAGTIPMLAGHAWKVHFEGASIPIVHGEDRAPGAANYILGNDPARWRSAVPAFSTVHYTDVWPGIDLVMKQHDGSFKYDILLRAGADPSRVALRYEGLDGMELNDRGELQLRTSQGALLESRPVAWYGDGDGEKVECRYIVKDGVLGYVLDGADHERPIVIDPTLIASTLSGSSSTNYGHCATYDEAGNIYTGAISFGAGYPTTTGAFQMPFGGGGTDIAVSKLDPNGSQLLYATYIGGLASDHPHSMVVTALGELIVLGSTQSQDYPTSASAFDPTYNGMRDVVVTKLNATGSALVGSTFVGGSNNDGVNNLTTNYGDNYRGEIITDGIGRAYVVVNSTSTDFSFPATAYQPNSAGETDGMLFCLSQDLSDMEWGTWFGTFETDILLGLRLDGNGDVFVCGASDSQQLPTTSGSFQPTSMGGPDGFVAHFTQQGEALQACTYFGSTGFDAAFFIDLDNMGNVYIYGQTTGVIPVEPATTYSTSEGRVFLAKFTPDLGTRMLSTRFGAPAFGALIPIAFLVDACNKVYISAHGGLGGVASGIPTTADAFQTNGGFYVGVFEQDVTDLLFGTYYGDGSDHVDGGTSRFDKRGVIYQGVCTGGGFPTTPGAWSSTQSSSWDIAVFKIDLEQAGVIAAVTASANVGCAPDVISFTAGGNAVTYQWDLGDGSPTVEGEEVEHAYAQPGTYEVMLVGFDPASCNLSDTTYYTVQIFAPGQLLADLEVVQVSACGTLEVVGTNTTQGSGLTATWDMGDGTQLSGNTVQHTYAAPGAYEVTITVNEPVCGDEGTASLVVEVSSDFTVDIGPDLVVCPGGTVEIDAFQPNATYVWSTGATTSSIVVGQPGTYTVTITDSEGCVGSDDVVVGSAPDPGPLQDTVFTCVGRPVQLQGPLDGGAYTWDLGATGQVVTVTDLGSYGYLVVDSFGCTYAGLVAVVEDPDDIVVTVPNVISPNGDGRNDRFQPESGGSLDVAVTIYDRWGLEMFSSPTLARTWDGRHEGGIVPEGTYFYVVRYSPACKEQPVVETGHVTVLR